MTSNIFPVLIGYLIGSIPFGYIAGKLMGIDIRKVGSGNIGATNAFRALGAGPASVVFILDLLKGTAAVLIAQRIFPPDHLVIILSGLAAVVGHMYPVFLRFRGGKGSATGLGVLLGIAPLLFIIAMIYVAAVILATRYVSVASITGAILLSILMFAFNEPIEYSVATLLIAALIIYKHIPNIKRLLAGTENRIGGGK